MQAPDFASWTRDDWNKYNARFQADMDKLLAKLKTMEAQMQVAEAWRKNMEAYFGSNKDERIR